MPVVARMAGAKPVLMPTSSWYRTGPFGKCSACRKPFFSCVTASWNEDFCKEALPALSQYSALFSGWLASAKWWVQAVPVPFRLLRGKRFRWSRQFAMQLGAPRSQERSVSSVLDQRVLEGIGTFRRLATALHQARTQQLVEQHRQFTLGNPSNFRKHDMVKRSTDDGADLCDFLCRPHAVKASLQRVGLSVATSIAPARPGELAAISTTDRVNSSTNSGTPSAWTTIRLRSSSSNLAAPCTLATIRVECSGSSLFRSVDVTRGRSAEGARNSGRCVINTRTGISEIFSTSNCKNSRVVGSIQCTSSKTRASAPLKLSPPLGLPRHSVSSAFGLQAAIAKPDNDLLSVRKAKQRRLVAFDRLAVRI